MLSSTRASALNAVVDAIRYGGLNAEVVVLITNKKCEALERAKGFGIPAVFMKSANKKREEYDKELYKTLMGYDPELVLLMGWMRILSPWFVERWRNKIINSHPSLLPEFAGGMDLEVHKAVLAAGKKESGVTLHFVDETIDGGPIILQKKISVALDETPYSLKEKAQATEQELFVEAIRLFGTGKIRARKQLVEA